MASLVECMKIAAIDAMEAAKPCAVMFGIVQSFSPLKINIEQKLTLDKEQLILSRNVTDYNALSVGDKVVLLRMQGGQRFVVLDRVV